MMMRAQSKNACSILTVSGRLTCSSVDPVKEAKNWVDKNSSKLNGQNQLIVLGAGSGYHLIELVKRYPELKIIVVDAHEEFISFCQSEHSLDLAHIQFIHAKDLNTLKENITIKKTIGQKYALLSFFPACANNMTYYRALEELLLGRIEEGFQFILSQRDNLQNLLQTAKIKIASQELISVKTLMQMINKNETGNETTLFKALRELVN